MEHVLHRVAATLWDPKSNSAACDANLKGFFFGPKKTGEKVRSELGIKCPSFRSVSVCMCIRYIYVIWYILYIVYIYDVIYTIQDCFCWWPNFFSLSSSLTMKPLLVREIWTWCNDVKCGSYPFYICAWCVFSYHKNTHLRSFHGVVLNKGCLMMIRYTASRGFRMHTSFWT